jgi:hypothetical protein
MMPILLRWGYAADINYLNIPIATNLLRYQGKGRKDTYG